MQKLIVEHTKLNINLLNVSINGILLSTLKIKRAHDTLCSFFAYATKRADTGNRSMSPYLALYSVYVFMRFVGIENSVNLLFFP